VSFFHSSTYQSSSHWMDSVKIDNVEKIQTWLISGKNIMHFTLRPKYFLLLPEFKLPQKCSHLVTRYQAVRTTEKVYKYVLCKCTTMLCYIYIAYIVTQTYTVLCWGPDDKFHSTKISLFLCSLNENYLYHYLHQRSLVYNPLTLKGDLAHRIHTVNIFTFPQATKNLFEGTKLPTHDGWQSL